MISSQKVRPSMQITLTDIFQDFNDPRKDMLVKRVALVLSDQEKRLMSELDSVNLTNLQKMLRKDHQLKTVEQKLRVKEEEIDQLQTQLSYSRTKIIQLQAQSAKYSEMIKLSEKKFSQMIKSLRGLEEVVQIKDSEYEDLQRQKKDLIYQNQKLQRQRARFQHTIFNLRQNYDQKLQDTEISIRIKEKNLNEKYKQDMNNIKITQLIQTQQSQVQMKIKNSQNFKNQRIQCDLIRHSSPSPSERQSARLSRLSARKAAPKPPKVQKVELGVQTEQTKERQLTQFMERNESPISQNDNLDQIRLIYSNPPRQIPLPEPKITKCIATIQESREIQTIPPTPRYYQQKQIQAYTQMKSHLIQSQLYELKLKFQEARVKTQKQYRQLYSKYVKAVKQYEKVEDLQLKTRAMELLLDQKNSELIRERDVLARTNQQLQSLQNQLAGTKLGQQAPLRSSQQNNYYSRTCSLFYSTSKNKSTVFETPAKRLSMNPTVSLKESQEAFSPRKWDEEESDLITIIKQANNLTTFKVRQRSKTQANPSTISPSGSLVVKRKYGKYSLIKKK